MARAVKEKSYVFNDKLKNVSTSGLALPVCRQRRHV
jgi:hypothetical protein